MNTIEKRKLRSDQGNPLIPLLLGVQITLDALADHLSRQDSQEPLPINDDAVLVALGLIRVRQTLQRWLPRHQHTEPLADLDPEVMIALSSLQR